MQANGAEQVNGYPLLPGEEASPHTERFSSCFDLVSLQDEDGLGDLACAPGAAA